MGLYSIGDIQEAEQRGHTAGQEQMFVQMVRWGQNQGIYRQYCFGCARECSACGIFWLLSVATAIAIERGI